MLCHLNMVLLLAADEEGGLSTCGFAGNIFKNQYQLVGNSICSDKRLDE